MGSDKAAMRAKNSNQIRNQPILKQQEEIRTACHIYRLHRETICKVTWSTFFEPGFLFFIFPKMKWSIYNHRFASGFLLDSTLTKIRSARSTSTFLIRGKRRLHFVKQKQQCTFAAMQIRDDISYVAHENAQHTCDCSAEILLANPARGFTNQILHITAWSNSIHSVQYKGNYCAPIMH